MTERVNAWSRLAYEDPRKVLVGLREAANELNTMAQAGGVELDPMSLRLRTTGTKKYREWRDAAIFTYGLSQLKGIPIYFAAEEASDYDVVTAWKVGDETFFCPLQLKELPPEDLNPRVTLRAIVDSLSKYSTPSDTALAIKLSKRPELDLTSLRVPQSTFSEVYLFWANSPDSATFVIYGDLKDDPSASEFVYPV
jgi:hypothetical protein